MRKVFFVYLFLLLPFFLNAQDFLEYGVRIGANYSTISSPNLETGRLIGIDAGIFRSFLINDNLDLIGEVSYSQKGASTFSGDETYPIKIITFTAYSIANIYLSAPNLSLQLGANYGFEQIRDLYSDQITLDGTGQYDLATLALAVENDFNIGLLAGISVGTQYVRFNVRYIYDVIPRQLFFSAPSEDKGNLHYLQLSMSFFLPNLMY